jgi:signal transduction histidine kinase
MAASMNAKATRARTVLSQDYAAALAQHLKDGGDSDLQKAADLGKEALAHGLETSAVVRIHEKALLTAIALDSSFLSRDGFIKRAQVFLLRAITPIERVHAAAMASQTRSIQFTAILRRRMAELARSRQNLKTSIIERKTAQDALRIMRSQISKLEAESASLRLDRRRFVNRAFSGLEKEQAWLSRMLDDEIAQALVAINVRLLIVQQKRIGKAKKLRKDIAIAQRLLERSMKRLRRFTLEFEGRSEK